MMTHETHRDLDYGDVTADADRMQAVLEMRELGHTDACIDDGRPGDEPTPNCPGCAKVADGYLDLKRADEVEVGDQLVRRANNSTGTVVLVQRVRGHMIHITTTHFTREVYEATMLEVWVS